VAISKYRSRASSGASSFAWVEQLKPGDDEAMNNSRTKGRARFGIYLPPRKSRIVDVLAAAGDAGIAIDELIASVWNGVGGNRNTLKSHVNQLNEQLAGRGVCIRSERGGQRPARYYLTQLSARDSRKQ
jgi:DNA-binding response OmpR family regulator